jgi:hypothetical protein
VVRVFAPHFGKTRSMLNAASIKISYRKGLRGRFANLEVQSVNIIVKEKSQQSASEQTQKGYLPCNLLEKWLLWQDTLIRRLGTS